MDELTKEFVEESRDHIAAINDGLLTLEKDPSDEDAMDAVFRSAHTLKGNSGAMQFGGLNDLAHRMEDVLDAARDGELELDDEVVDDLFVAIDTFESRISDIEGGDQDLPYPDDILDTLDEHLAAASDEEDADAGDSSVPDGEEPDTCQGTTDEGDPCSLPPQAGSRYCRHHGPEDDSDVALDDPSAEDLDELAETVPADATGSTVFYFRLAVDTDVDLADGEMDALESLHDAFEVYATNPDSPDIHGDDAQFDAVIAGDLSADNVESAMVSHPQVLDAKLYEITDRTDIGADTDEFDLTVEPEDGADEDGDDMDVDELLDEASEFDNLDEIDEDEVEDVDAEIDMDATAGTFDDVDAGSEDTDESQDSDDDGPVSDNKGVRVFEELQDEVEETDEFEEVEQEMEQMDFDFGDTDDSDAVEFDDLVDADEEDFDFDDGDSADDTEDLFGDDSADDADTSDDGLFDDIDEDMDHDASMDVDFEEEADLSGLEPEDDDLEDDVEVDFEDVAGETADDTSDEAFDDGVDDIVDEPAGADDAEPSTADTESVPEAEAEAEAEADAGADDESASDVGPDADEVTSVFDSDADMDSFDSAFDASDGLDDFDDLLAEAGRDTEAGSDIEIQNINVDVDRLDELYTQVQELVTNRIRLRRAVEELDLDDDSELVQVLEEIDELETITERMQDTVMDIRLVPLEHATRRLPRIARDVAREHEKEVELEIEGDDVELDRGILTQLGDPLMHLVRNAVDHGIEDPEIREEIGKPREGTVKIEARRTRDRVTITVTDDGSGINADALREEAVEAGLLTPEQAQQLSDEQAYELIFRPHFSTADEVTDTSGRGVGMDVVYETIRGVDGNVSVSSKPGEGTQIRMQVPVSLAILKVLFVNVGGEMYGIPIKTISDITHPGEFAEIDGEEVHTEDGETYPLIRLSEALNVPGVGAAPESASADATGGAASDADEDVEVASEVADPDELADQGKRLVRIDDSVRSVTLLCDGIARQEDVVVKPYDGVLSRIPGLSGAAVLGEGNVVNILDVGTL